MNTSNGLWRRFRVLVLLAVAALLAVGVLLWQQQSRERPLPGGNPALAPTPVSGGHYVEALVGQPARFNPLLDSYNRVDRDVDRLLYCSLIRFDSRGVPQGAVAESWGISQDGTIYNFALRDGVTWDDGQPVTAEDVVFTVNLMRNPALPIPADVRDFWSEVEVQPLGDGRTVQFHLPEAFAPFLDYLTFGLLPKHVWANVPPEQIPASPLNLQPVGCGPYQFDHLLVENGAITGVVLRANEYYYLGRPYIDEVTFRYYASPQEALQAYQAGKVLGIDRITPDILSKALAEPHLNFYTARLPKLSLILFNLQNPQVPFFQDPVVRRALYQGLNRQWMVDHVLQGQAILADGPIFPGTWAYYDKVPRVAYDPEGAVSLLREAKYTFPKEGTQVRAKDGQELAFDLVYPDDDTHQALAEAIREDWAALGVAVHLVPVGYGRLISDYLEPRTYQAALVDLDLSRTPDPDPYPFWHQAMITGGQNYSMWDDRRASEYLEQARTTPDIAQRMKLYSNFQVYFARQLPALPLFYPLYTYAVDARVQGIRLGPVFDLSDRFNNIAKWHMQAAPAAVQPTMEESIATP